LRSLIKAEQQVLGNTTAKQGVVIMARVQQQVIDKALKAIGNGVTV
jgi:hypothetical protein